MKQKCPLCKTGEISWDSKEESYSCGICSFEVSFSFNGKHPFVAMKGKHHLGSFIGFKKGNLAENDNSWDKLRIVHRNISLDEEWKRRKEHFDEQVDKYRAVVKRYWAAENASRLCDYEKGDLISKIANERTIPQTAICEILKQENLNNRSRYLVWEFINTQKYGKQIEFLWKKFHCDKFAKQGDKFKLNLGIQKISNNIGLNPYLVSKILINTGAYKFGNWALWESKQIEENGAMIALLWGNKKHKVKNDWSLCEVIDEICDIGKLNPYIVLNSLAGAKRINLNSKIAFTIYSTYKYAKLFLEEIRKNGPATAPKLSKKFGIGNRIANYAVSALYKRNILKRDRETKCRDLVYFLPNQRKQLEKTNPYLKLEDIILNQSQSYVTITNSILQDYSKSTANTVLRYWADRGRILKFDDTYPTIYIILNGSKEKSIKRALKDKFTALLTHVPSEGIELRMLYNNVNSQIRTCKYKTFIKRLELLADYNIISTNNNKVYFAR